MNNGSKNIFRSKLFSIQTDFSKVKPLVQSSKNLALNAELNAARLGQAGNAFGVVARELGGIMKNLDQLVGEQQGIFRDISRITAEWMKAEQRTRLYQRACNTINLNSKQAETATAQLSRVSAGGQGVSAGGEGGEGNQAAQPALHQKALLSSGNNTVTKCRDEATAATVNHQSANEFVNLLSSIQAREQVAIQNSLAAIRANTRKIEKLVEKMGWIATRQGHFTAITANVEAARDDSSLQVLGPVARSIREFANTLMAAETDLRKSIGNVFQLT